MNNKWQLQNPLSRAISLAATVALAITVVFVLTVVLMQSARAQTYTVIHDFTGGADGGYPITGLTMDAAGKFYGTTGGVGNRGNLNTVF